MAYKLENNPLFNPQEEKKPEIAPAQLTKLRGIGANMLRPTPPAKV